MTRFQASTNSKQTVSRESKYCPFQQVDSKSDELSRLINEIEVQMGAVSNQLEQLSKALKKA